MAVALTVRLGPAAEAVAFHHAGEAAALGDGRDIHAIREGEEVGEGEGLADRQGVVGVVDGAELGEVAEEPVGAQVPALRPGQFAFAGWSEAHLHGLVAVAGVRLDLGHGAGADFQDRAAADGAVGGDHLDHSQFLAQETFQGHARPSLLFCRH